MDQAIKDRVYDQAGSEHSKNAIFIWFPVGLVWIFLDSSIALFSLKGILFIFPGLFIASFASMPLFLIRNKIALNVIEKKQESLTSLIPILNILDVVEMAIAPILFIKILEIFI